MTKKNKRLATVTIGVIAILLFGLSMMQFPGQTIKAEATTIRKAVPKVVLSGKSKKLTIIKLQLRNMVLLL